MSEIRQRNTNMNTNSMPSNLSQPAQPGKALAASTLLKSSPSHHGKVMKLNVPLIYSIAPTWLQRLLRMCPTPLKPSWKKRYMIQIGKYLYRYQISDTENQNKMKLKGTPIEVKNLQIKSMLLTTFGIQHEANDDVIAFAGDLPTFCSGYFSITSDGETRYYAVEAKEDANTWINSLRQGRQANIELAMGHDRSPYPSSWKYIDAMGDERVQRNKRVKEIVKRSDQKEMEMMNFMDGGRGGHFG